MYKNLIEKFKSDVESYEAIILKDGTIVDAEGDFVSGLLDLVSNKYNISHKMLATLCPHSKPMEIVGWLCINAEAVCINVNALLLYTVSEDQIRVIQQFKEAGLYRGEIPYYRCN